MKAPFPYFGGKSQIASWVWTLFGPDIRNYVEPFAGGAAVLTATGSGSGTFSGTVQNTSGSVELDYSGSGNTFALDYAGSNAPTVFQFTGIEVTNNYVSSSPAAVQLDGLPLDQRKYPVDTHNRAVNAKARATQAVKAGRMSKSTEATIDKKANKVLGKGKSRCK